MSKTLIIQVDTKQTTTLKKSDFVLCIARSISDTKGISHGDNTPVIWSAVNFLRETIFSWENHYHVSEATQSNGSDPIIAQSDMQSIAPGQTCIFDKYGGLKQATGDVDTSGKFQVMNQYDVPMKFGLTCALSVVGTVENSSSPKGTFYVTPDVLHNDGIELTPIDKVVVWFQSKAEGDSMISAMIKEKLEVDFSGSHAADLLL